MRNICVTSAVVVSIVAAGCAGPPASRLNAPPQGTSARPHELQEPYIQMTDSAILADMSVADVHFVPHSGELNSLGEGRMERYVEILKLHGGRLRYDNQTMENALIKNRLYSLREFLETSGVDMSRVKVVSDLAGGRGMDAEEAIEAMAAGRSGEQGSSQSVGLGSVMGTGGGGG